jgi:hypothetical protein
MANRGIVTLQGLDKDAIQRQIEQLRSLQRAVREQDSLDAVILADTLQLLVRIEKALNEQDRVIH